MHIPSTLPLSLLLQALQEGVDSSAGRGQALVAAAGLALGRAQLGAVTLCAGVRVFEC